MPQTSPFAASSGCGPSWVSLHPNWSHSLKSHKIMRGSDGKWFDVALLCCSPTKAFLLPKGDDNYQKHVLEGLATQKLVLASSATALPGSLLQWKSMPLSPTRAMNQNLWSWGPGTFFNKLSRWFLRVLKFEICSKSLSYVDFSATLPSEWAPKGWNEQLLSGSYNCYQRVKHRFSLRRTAKETC